MKKFDILNENRLMICAHSGVSGGNIPRNTAISFDIAMMQGADIVELDVTASADGELFVFHPCTEKTALARPDLDIRTMPAEEVKKLPCASHGGALTKHTIPLLDDIFEHLKGKCYINVDKFGDNPVEIMKKVKKHGIQDQIILKSSPKEEVLRMIEETAPDINYLAIIGKKYEPFSTHEMLMSRNINYVGLEVVFEEDSSPLVSDAFRARMRADKKLLWGNSILYNYKVKLAAEHSDDTALAGDPVTGWGWFADKNFDIVQTDWPREISMFLKEYCKK
jgi:glycerophosphoryl diester phosphodiesterase